MRRALSRFHPVYLYPRQMRTRTELPLADGSILPVTRWSPDSPDQSTGSDSRDTPPLLLLTCDDRVEIWDAFAEYAASRWRVTLCCSPTANQLLQAIWSIGEPTVVCAYGADAGIVALSAQAVAPGAIPMAVLIDFRLEGHALPPSAGYVEAAIVRGRQSTVATHTEAVEARATIGGTCVLVELENCGDNAAVSCPAEFESAVRWLTFGE